MSDISSCFSFTLTFLQTFSNLPPFFYLLSPTFHSFFPLLVCQDNSLFLPQESTPSFTQSLPFHLVIYGHLCSSLLFPWKLFKRIFFFFKSMFVLRLHFFVFVSKVCSQMPDSLIQIKQVNNCFHNSERIDHGNWLMEAAGTEVLLKLSS